jgi:exopolyphosphatase/guanosine-5'-triphosphate,3'-diphosphate pyrophosphatase
VTRRDLVAAIDLGTMATKLLVTDGTSRQRRTVDTRTGGAALAPTGQVRGEAIAPAALDRIAEALEGFRPLVGPCAEVAVVATASARRATNRDALVDLVDQVLGVELEVLDPDTEARLAYRGAVSDPGAIAGAGLDPGDWIVTIDLGGGSTEVTMGTLAGPEAAYSLPVGGTLLTEAYLESDPPRPEELSAALSVVELHIEDVRRELPALASALDGAVVVGLGAITTIAAVEVGLADVDPNNGEGDGPLHGHELLRRDVEEVFRTIATESRADRAFNPGLPVSRVDDVVGACALLVETMRQLQLDRLVVSQRGLLDGLAARLLGVEGEG